MNILVPNLGSTSLKYQLLEMPAETVLAKGRVERVKDYREAIARIETGGARQASPSTDSMERRISSSANGRLGCSDVHAMRCVW